MDTLNGQRDFLAFFSLASAGSEDCCTKYYRSPRTMTPLDQSLGPWYFGCCSTCKNVFNILVVGIKIEGFVVYNGMVGNGF